MIRVDATNLVPLSFNVSSKGNQRKWISKDRMYYVKECYIDENGKQWRDDMVERCAYQLFTSLGMEQYGLKMPFTDVCEIVTHDRFGGSVVLKGSITNNFLEDEEEWISFDRMDILTIEKAADENILFERKNTFNSAVQSIIDVYLAYIEDEDAIRFYLGYIALSDLLLLNSHRHKNNFGMVRRTDGECVVSPVFDYGLGLFEGSDRYRSLPFDTLTKTFQFQPFMKTYADIKKIIVLPLLGDMLNVLLQKPINLIDFTFPSQEAESYFITACLDFGFKVQKG